MKVFYELVNISFLREGCTLSPAHFTGIRAVSEQAKASHYSLSRQLLASASNLLREPDCHAYKCWEMSAAVRKGKEEVLRR